MKVFIITEPDDIHAVLVKLALKRKGVDCNILFSADMPSIQENSIEINNKEFKWVSSDPENHPLEFSSPEISTIWWRRPRRPYIPNYANEDDIEFIRRENNIYHDSIPYLFNQSAWWVNPIKSHEKTRSKIIQLQVAKKCGLSIPDTLISNSPSDIKKFIAQHGDSSVIYKSFAPHFWSENQNVRILYTSKVTLEDLPSDKMLHIVPGIYQKYVEKKYELRITCFGKHISAVRIESQNHEKGKTDWRKIPSNDQSLQAVDIPDYLKNKLIRYMNEIGIVFGCFDFIVTPENDYIFLEVNEQGQFLWIEDLNPHIPYLDIFTEFLINRTFDFTWTKHKKIIHCSDLDKQAQEIVENNVRTHVYLNAIK